MKLTYIFHSGFVLETNQSILIFDFWMDPVGIMESVLQMSQGQVTDMLMLMAFMVHEDRKK